MEASIEIDKTPIKVSKKSKVTAKSSATAAGRHASPERRKTVQSKIQFNKPSTPTVFPQIFILFNIEI